MAHYCSTNEFLKLDTVTEGVRGKEWKRRRTRRYGKLS